MDRIDDTIDELKELHSSDYNSIQYRVWAECIIAGTHTSLEFPPKGSYFKKKTASSTPRKNAVTETKDLTPSKSASLRTTYIQQIKDVHNLMEIGAIDKEHFLSQRDILLKQMDSLNTN